MQKPYETNTEESNRSHATVNGGHANVDRLSNNVLGRFKRFGKILKKVAERSRDSIWGHATVGRLSNNVFGRFKTFFKNFPNCLKRPKTLFDSRPTVT